MVIRGKERHEGWVSGRNNCRMSKIGNYAGAEKGRVGNGERPLKGQSKQSKGGGRERGNQQNDRTTSYASDKKRDFNRSVIGTCEEGREHRT